MESGTFAKAKASADLLEYVQKYTGQKGRGNRTVAFICPKHNERTGSLMVNTETQTWRCFGACGCGGDVIDFVTWMEFGTIQKGAMPKDADGYTDKTSPKYKALEIILGNIDSGYKPKPAKPITRWQRAPVNQRDIEDAKSNRRVAVEYFVGKRKLNESTVDSRSLGAALAYPHYFHWKDEKHKDDKFTCIRYSIPWMRGGLAYMVNYRRDDADCMRQLGLLDPEYLFDIRTDISPDNPGGVTDQELIRYLYGDKYLRNKGSSGFTIFNLDRIMTPKYLMYCTINEAEISAISCEELGVYSTSASYKYGIDFKKAYEMVHMPVIFADNDGGTGLAKASTLAEAIGNPRTQIKVVPAPFKDINELTCYDKLNGTSYFNDLIRSVGII